MEKDVFKQLLDIGLSGDFSKVDSVTGAGSWDEVIKITPHRNGIDSFCQGLALGERKAFVKAVAVYENTAGSLGSVTSLARLLPLIENDEDIFDWILQNTSSYNYYSGGAKSFEEYDNIQKSKQENRAKSLENESAIQEAAQKSRSSKASEDLPKAVLRGDLKAVQALLAKGADPRTDNVEGKSLLAIASANGWNEIVSELESNLESCRKD
jgi:ankyrin repeat protein